MEVLYIIYKLTIHVPIRYTGVESGTFVNEQVAVSQHYRQCPVDNQDLLQQKYLVNKLNDIKLCFYV